VPSVTALRKYNYYLQRIFDGMQKETEKESRYRHLEKMSTAELLNNINKEDAEVHKAVATQIPNIQQFVDRLFENMQLGGRLFYVGAGTSGRLGIVDASECPPTFGVSRGLVIGIIAGGDGAIRKAVEFAEDDENGAWKDLDSYKLAVTDTVVGIAASGTTPYVVGALKNAQAKGLTTACITCNLDTPVSQFADYRIEAIVGPEFVTGSTRMKAGTAQKLILNMISTSVLIKMGHVKDNKMVDMQLSNNKLVERGTLMLMKELNLTENVAQKLLLKWGSVRKAMENYSDQ